MDDLCPTCGAPKYHYSEEFVQMWTELMRFFPVYSLPEIHGCKECIEHAAGLPVSAFYRARRREWLRSTSDVTILDVNDKDVLRQLKHGQRVAREYRKLLKKQKEKMLKLRTRRFMKREMKPFKERAKEIRQVLEQAADLAREETP